MVQPFVVAIPNRPGELAHLARALAARGINIRHIVACGAGDCGSVVLATDDVAATQEVLHSIGVEFIQGEAFVVDTEDRPGALASLTEKLASAGVNIHGVLIVGHHDGLVDIAFSVDDEARAREILGVPLLLEVPSL